jgi:acetoin utilization protein AcuC
MRTAFIYSEKFETFTYSPTHPLKPVRYRLMYELANAYGLFKLPQTHLITPEPCSDKELATVHSIEYIDAVRCGAECVPEWNLLDFGLGTEDNPISHRVYGASLLAVGASLQAAQLVADSEVDVAFNIAGGQHHASKSRASGFCYFNDVAVAIWYLLSRGYRVAYIDIDAHHSDGVQEIFYRTDQVLKISIHESGEYLFPWSGFEKEIGQGKGEGHTVNIPLLPYSDDEVFWQAFDGIVPELLDAFQPDVLVTQLGVDTHQTDPLTTMSVTTQGFCRVVEALKQCSPGKWVALGGGGYDVLHVPRAWTLAWAIMNDIELPEPLPESYCRFVTERLNMNGTRTLHDGSLPVDHTIRQRNLEALKHSLHYIRNHQLKMLMRQHA